MKRLLLGVGLVALSAGAAAAAPAVVQSGVNLRSGPGTEYAVIDSMPAGARVDVSGCTGGWCQVAFNGEQGYASRAYLDLQVAAAVPGYEYDGPAYGYYYEPGSAYGYDYGYPGVGLEFGFRGHRHHYGEHDHRHRNWIGQGGDHHRLGPDNNRAVVGNRGSSRAPNIGASRGPIAGGQAGGIAGAGARMGAGTVGAGGPTAAGASLGGRTGGGAPAGGGQPGRGSSR